jgi:hypothetical protein
VSSDSKVESFLSAELNHVFVSSDTGSFKGLRGKLLQLIGDDVNAERESIDGGSLVTGVENSDLRIRYTTAVTRLYERLVLAIAVAASWSYLSRKRVHYYQSNVK